MFKLLNATFRAHLRSFVYFLLTLLSTASPNVLGSDRGRFGLLAFAVLALATTPDGLFAQETSWLAGVNAEDVRTHGSGIFFHTQDGCWVLTPNHVVEKVDVVKVKAVRPGGYDYSIADICLRSNRYDLALLRLTNPPKLSQCGELFTGAEGSAPLLNRSSVGTVLWVDPSGGIQSDKSVSIRQETADGHYFYFSTHDGLIEGMSGGIIVEDTQPVGILLNAADEECRGSPCGKALKLASAQGDVEGDLLPTVRNSDRLAPVCLPRRHSLASSEGNNLASTSCGASLEIPDAEPDISHRPDVLIAPLSTGGYWRGRSMGEKTPAAALPSMPIITINLDLCGSKARDISEIILDTTTLPDQVLFPVRVEITFSGVEDGVPNWVSSEKKDLNPTGTRTNISLGAGKHAKSIKIQLYSQNRAIGLSRIEVH